MKNIVAWHQKHQSVLRVIRTSLGGTFLLTSLILTWTNNASVVPFDLAWFAVVFCGLPIAIGALIGLIKYHDVTADVLVSLALIGCLVLKEYAAAGEVAFIMEIGTILEDFTSGKAQKGNRKPDSDVAFPSPKGPGRQRRECRSGVDPA